MSSSYQDRLDPGRGTERAAEAVHALTRGPLGEWLRGQGVDEDAFRVGTDAPQKYAELMSAMSEVAQRLAPLGWVAFSGAPVNEYRQAARLVEQGDPEAAEALLVEKWNDSEVLRWGVNRLGGLYRGDRETEALGHARWQLVAEAYENHCDERYASAVSVVLEQLDGLVYDMTGKDAKSFFAAEAKAEHLEDEVTVAGHPAGLRVLADLFNKGVKRTVVDDSLRRHGIAHGRVLAYGTRANSTKAFVALLSVMEWAKPIAGRQAAERTAEREAKYAASTKRDEFGKLLDRRGFEEAKRAVQRVEYCQRGCWAREGRYTDSLAELFEEELATVTGLRIEVGDNGASFRTWAPTATDIFFGVAGADGEYAGWEYVGLGPPPEDFRSEDAWRHSATDYGHPDW